MSSVPSPAWPYPQGATVRPYAAETPKSNWSPEVHPPGLEPGRPCEHGPLKPACLPFHHECEVIHRSRSRACGSRELRGFPLGSLFVR